MFKQKAWLFEGDSGTHYTFEIYSKKSELPKTGGIFILAYTHPRGHLAGYQVHTLSMGVTDNLQLEIAALPQQKCLQDECWNSTFILRLDEPETRSESLKDLLKKYPVPC